MIEPRPVVLIANSCWYLAHYRLQLIKDLKKKFSSVIVIAPLDSSSKQISLVALHVPWSISRSKDSSIFSLVKSFLRLLLLVRAVKPALIHSHTLKANLVSSLVANILGLPIIYSFAGLGRLSQTKGIKSFVFAYILKLIVRLSHYRRVSRFAFKSVEPPNLYIFQNHHDRDLFKKYVPFAGDHNLHTIYGSGVPTQYLVPFRGRNYFDDHFDSNFAISSLSPIFCARLLISKGILTFCELAQLLPQNQFHVFGSIDASARDSLREIQLAELTKRSSNITFYGHVSQPLLHRRPPYSILIVPTAYGEGLPRAIAEALALRIPVITSRKGTVGLFSDDLVYIVDSDDPLSYQAALFQIFSDFQSGVLSKKLDRGFDFLTQNLQETSISSQTLALYDSLLSGQSDNYILSKNQSDLVFRRLS